MDNGERTFGELLTYLREQKYSVLIGNLTTESTASRRSGRAETGPH